MSRGLFISFEGIDGSGKSTQARLLHERLRGSGRPALLTREPGGSPGAEDIRALVLNGAADRWSPETELLLFTAARRDHLEKTILPALARGDIVITDRFADSTRIYQGCTRPDLRPHIETLHHLMIGREPDITFLIDMDPATGLERAFARSGNELRFEQMGLQRQQDMRRDFLRLAQHHKDRMIIINGGQDMNLIADEIWDHTSRYLGRYLGDFPCHPSI